MRKLAHAPRSFNDHYHRYRCTALLPEQVEWLVEIPLRNESVAVRVSNVISTSANSVRVPLLSTDPNTGGFVAEGAEVVIGEPALAEKDIPVLKASVLCVLSQEMVEDSEPDALNMVGRSLVARLVSVIDASFFANTTTNGPAGLLSITPTLADAADAWANTDAFEFAKSNAEQHGTVLNYFCCNPATALKLSTLKAYSTAGSNINLLQADPASPAGRVISGVPVLTSPSIGNDIVYGIPQNRVTFALRKGLTVSADHSVFWTRQRVGLMATARVGWAFLDPTAITKITTSP